MKIKFTSLLFLISLCFSFQIKAQHLMVKMPLDQQVENSKVIVEGKVINKQSYFNADRTHIYTVNTIEVYKSFKGNATKEIQVVTQGGSVEDRIEIINPSLMVNKDDIGLYLLTEADISFANNIGNNQFFKPYASAQGFYRYNIESDKASNMFEVKHHITDELYPEIKNLVGEDFVSLTDFNVKEERSNFNRTSNTMEITSISPTTISAGTESILTINGSGFGNQFKVEFSFTNDGGSSFEAAYEDQIISWTDTEILVEVPSFAGTGPVKVINDFATTFLSDELTVIYSHLNFPNNEGTDEFNTQLIDDDPFTAGGQYRFLYHTEFNNNVAARESFQRAFDQWVCDTGINFYIQGTNGTDVSEFDGLNMIRFDNGAELAPGTLATAGSYGFSCSDGTGGVDIYIGEIDVTFDDAREWEYGPEEPTGSEVDFETVAVHELGHAAQLGHIIDPGAIMHYAIGPSTLNRILSANDILGAEAVLNRSNNDPVCNQPVMTQSSCSLSTEDLISDSIKIYPNPTSDIIIIKSSGVLRIENLSLYDINGRKILERDNFTIQPNNSVRLNDITSGVYFANIKTDKGSAVKKVVVE